MTLPRGEFAEDGDFAEEDEFAQDGDFAQEGNVAEEGGIFAQDGNVIEKGEFANEGFVVNIPCHRQSHNDEHALAHDGYALLLAHEGLFQLPSLLPLRNAMACNFSSCACTQWLTSSPCFAHAGLKDAIVCVAQLQSLTSASAPLTIVWSSLCTGSQTDWLMQTKGGGSTRGTRCCKLVQGCASAQTQRQM
jgi:hypothetical protein